MSNPATKPTEAQAMTTGALAEVLGATLDGPPDLPLERLETLERADSRSLSFIRSNQYAQLWPSSEAAAALVTTGIEVPDHDARRRALLVVEDADLALVRVLDALAGPPPSYEPGVHPSATIDPDATIDPTAHIGPQCVVGRGSSIGPGSALIAQVYIGADVHIGARTVLMPGVRIMDRCRVGDACLFHPGVSIGADGFGYRPDPEGRGLVKIPHIGNAVIGHHVEIGANSCVDRAKFGQTIIGDGTKIDNLVQIAHNCTIGRACILCGHVGLSGSVTLGDGVVLGGGVGIADNLTIGSGARVAADAGVMNNIPPGESWLGAPAGPAREQIANYAAFRKLSDLARDFRKFQKRNAAATNNDNAR